MSFLQKIQNSDESVKKKWVMALSAASMIIIIAGWLIYMNHILAGSSQNGQVEKIGFWQVFETGLKVSKDSVSEKIKNLFSGFPKLGGTKEIIIENSQ